MADISVRGILATGVMILIQNWIKSGKAFICSETEITQFLLDFSHLNSFISLDTQTGPRDRHEHTLPQAERGAGKSGPDGRTNFST
jgi:hypothetical protein